MSNLAKRQERFREIAAEITEHCDCKDGYCFWRELVEHNVPSLKMVIQVECIQKYKWEESQRQGHDIENENTGGCHGAAAQQWVESGLAAAFGKVYDEDLTVKQIYHRTLEELKRQKDDIEKERKAEDTAAGL